MIDLNNINFATRVSCTGSFNLAHRNAACFGFILNRMFDNKRYTMTYKIKMCKNNSDFENGYNNMCLFNRKTIIEHLDYIKDLDFKYDLKSDIEDWILTLKINGYRIKHQFILSWVRYLYEAPFNFALADALKLRKTKDFKDLNMFDLVGMLITASNCTNCNLDQHALGNRTVWCGKTNFETVLKDVKRRNVKRLYELFPQSLYKIYYRYHEGSIDLPKRTMFKYLDTQYETTPDVYLKEHYSERKAIYKHNLNALKKLGLF